MSAHSLYDSPPTTNIHYGETGWQVGGRLRPHKTHQNGLSVDFFVPVLNSRGASVALPGSIFNQFGYGIRQNFS